MAATSKSTGYASRSSKGLSLIEMLTAVMLTGFIAAATCDMLAALSIVSLKSDYQLTSTLQCKRVLDLLGQQIRSAQSLTISDEPSQKLVLNIPVVGIRNGLNNIPLMHDGSSVMDVFTYTIVPDADRPGTGEYILQRTCTCAPSEWRTDGAQCLLSNGQIQVLMKGIVGPQDLTLSIDGTTSNYRPRVFTYLKILPPLAPNVNKTFPVIDKPIAGDEAAGVGIQFEIQPMQSPNKTIRSTTFAMRSEYFVRSQQYAN